MSDSDSPAERQRIKEQVAKYRAAWKKSLEAEKSEETASTPSIIYNSSPVRSTEKAAKHPAIHSARRTVMEVEEDGVPAPASPMITIAL